MNAASITAAEDAAFPEFPLLRVRFRAGSLGLVLPDYAGGVLRSGFGMALGRVSPAAFAALFGGGLSDETEQDKLFVPYMLVPLRGGAIPAGETFEFELRLFGAAAAHHAACVEALALLGRLGLGKQRGRFVLLAAAALAPGTAAMHWQDPAAAVPVVPAGAWRRTAAAAETTAVELDLLTPLRLKAQGRLVETAPPFAVLWARLVTRIHLAAGDAVLSAERRAALGETARAVATAAADVRWVDWARYSARQRQAMTFGGLLGRLAYRGELAPFVPWLHLGEALGVGGKTTFGLGAYRLTTSP